MEAQLRQKMASELRRSTQKYVPVELKWGGLETRDGLGCGRAYLSAIWQTAVSIAS